MWGWAIRGVRDRGRKQSAEPPVTELEQPYIGTLSEAGLAEWVFGAFGLPQPALLLACHVDESTATLADPFRDGVMGTCKAKVLRIKSFNAVLSLLRRAADSVVSQLSQ